MRRFDHPIQELLGGMAPDLDTVLADKLGVDDGPKLRCWRTTIRRKTRPPRELTSNIVFTNGLPWNED